MKMKAIFLSFCLVLSFAIAQESGGQSDQQNQTSQESTMSQSDQGMNDMGSTLEELRQIYDHLGQIIARLEGQNTGDMNAQMQAQRDALTQARTDLEALRGDIESGQANEDTAQAVESVRQNLRTSFENANEQDRAMTEEFDLLLGRLTEQLISGRAEDYESTYGQAFVMLEQSEQDMMNRSNMTGSESGGSSMSGETGGSGMSGDTGGSGASDENDGEETGGSETGGG